MNRLSKYYLIIFAILLILVLVIYLFTNQEEEDVIFIDGPIERITSIPEYASDVDQAEITLTPLEEEEMRWQELMQQYKEIKYTNTSLYDLEETAETANTEMIQWYGYEVEGRNIYYSESAREKYIYLIDAIPKIHEELKHYFGFPLQSNIPVYIVDQFDDPALMYKGYYVDHKNYLLLNARTKKDFDIRPLYAHEMAHLYQRQQWNMENLHKAFGIGERIWVTEGMAEYIATQKVSYPTILTPIGETLPHQLGYQQYKDRLDDVPSQDIAKMKSWPTFWYEHNYIIFESIIYYLETVYGHEAFINWIQLVSDGTSLSQATQEIFARTDVQIIADWKTFFDLH